MKTSRLNTILLSVAIAISIGLSMIIFSCSESPVNKITTTIDNYAESVRQATSVEEIQELDMQFAKKMETYSESNYKLTPSDRKTLMKSITALSEAVNSSFQRLTGISPMDDIVQREAAFKVQLDKCVTVGDFIEMGL